MKHLVDTLNGMREVEYLTPAEFLASGHLIEPAGEEMTDEERGTADVAQAKYELMLQEQAEAHQFWMAAMMRFALAQNDAARVAMGAPRDEMDAAKAAIVAAEADLDAAEADLEHCHEATQAAYRYVNELSGQRRARRAAEAAAQAAAAAEQARRTVTEARKKRRVWFVFGKNEA